MIIYADYAFFSVEIVYYKTSSRQMHISNLSEITNRYLLEYIGESFNTVYFYLFPTLNIITPL